MAAIDPLTGVLALGVVGLVVYAVGVEETTTAVSGAASRARSSASRGAAAGALGLGVGLQFGNDLVMAIMQNPFGVTTALAGVMGALGIEGVLAPLTGPQFLLIGFSVFAIVALFFND